MDKTTINTEIFEELLFYNNLDITALAKIIGISRQSLYRYRNNDITPCVETATKIAKAFNCRLNYLLGLGEDYERKFGNGECCFVDRLLSLLELRKISKYKLAKAIPMPESIIYTWLYKNAKPSLDSVARVANYLECSIDYLLGYDDEIN